MKIVPINRNIIVKSANNGKQNPSAQVYYDMLKQIDIMIESHQTDSTKSNSNESNRTENQSQ